jgi:hypothetical protein
MADAKEYAIDIINARLVPYLESSPGIGKSALGEELASDWRLKFIDERIASADPTDLTGFPYPDLVRMKGGYLPMETFPVVGDAIPKDKQGWFLMLDELASAVPSMQAAAYRLILDKRVGQKALHKKVVIMAAGNKTTDHAVANPLSTAMQSRMVHLNIHVCDEAWMRWADANNIDFRVKAFISFQPQLLHNFNPQHTDKTFACPRTWHFLSKIIKPWKDVSAHKMPVLAGTVGVGAARQFLSFSEVFGRIPTFSEIIADPKNVPFPDEPSMQYALAGLVGHKMSSSNGEQCMKFIERLNVDFQVTILRSAIAKDRKLKSSCKEIANWVLAHGKELV